LNHLFDKGTFSWWHRRNNNLAMKLQFSLATLLFAECGDDICPYRATTD
jgi:hypothetical protein